MKKTFKVKGMTCLSCENRIKKTLHKLPGMTEVKVSLSTAEAQVVFNETMTSEKEITDVINRLGYKVLTGGDSEKGNKSLMLGVLVLMIGLYFLISQTIGFNFIPEITQSMGYGMLFVVGLLTSIHCIAMCGGINLSQSIVDKTNNSSDSKISRFMPGVFYNSGRIISYTILGGIVGALGSVISLAGTSKGIVSIIAGLFMVMMGLKMMDVFPSLRKFNLTIPFLAKSRGKVKSNSPFIVGLLNGFMPCGPLQTMQIYALGTGSFVSGALSMFAFSIGTVPLMLGFSLVSSLLSSKFTHRMMKISAALVLILGVIMLNRGFALSGISMDIVKGAKSGSVAVIENGIQLVTTTVNASSYSPQTTIIQKGVPVKWTVNGKDINGCNSPITIPKLSVQQRLTRGENIIEFTPEEEGNLTYTCWMGMIRANFRVVDDLSKVSKSNVEAYSKDDSNTGGVDGCCGAGVGTPNN